MPERTAGQALTDMKRRRFSAPSPGRRSVRRPEEIQRDVRGLKLRQRVTTVLQDDYIRNELEETMRKHGDNAEDIDSVRAYQDFLVPSYGGGPGLTAVQPINDIRGTETLNYTKTERNLRCKLAAAYRLVDMFGWSQNIYGHLTVRCPTEHGRGDNFLINPFGLLYNEISASSLVKIDSEGNTIDGGSTNFGVNRAGWVIHSAIHMSRKDAKCAIHVHERSAVAVAACKHGILPISQESLVIGKVSYHDYEGIACDEGERERLANDFPEGSNVLVLRNHGLLCVGETIEEAFSYTYYAIAACQRQVQAMSVGLDNLIMLDDKIADKVQNAIRTGAVDTKKENIGIGMKEFEAWMRMLDAQGHRTGYIYHNPDLYNKTVVPPKSVGRSPATMTSYRYEFMYGDNQTPSRRLRSLGKGNTYKNRAKWLNSPVKATEYKKEYIQDNHSEPTTLKDSKPEKETAIKILEESKGPTKAKVIEESITITTPAIVKSEISADDLFNEDDKVFIEKGLNGAESKEVKAPQVTTTEVTTIEVTPSDGDDGTTQVVTTSRTVVKGYGEPVTTVEEKVIVNGEEQPADSSLLSPPNEVEEKEEVSDEGGDKEKEGDAEGAEGGKPRQKVKKKRSFKKAFQGMIHRKSKSEDDEKEKS